MQLVIMSSQKAGSSFCILDVECHFMKYIKTRSKIWVTYFITLLAANFFHELGHCIPAWSHGYAAVPTLAKEYSFDTIPDYLINYISLGGIIGSVFVFILSFTFFLKRSSEYNSAVLAGTLAMPCIYTLRFILIGRGHDATEFQEAQSALGFNYAGHVVDWLFLSIPLIGITVWIFKTNPNLKILGRLFIGAVLSLALMVVVQKLNNLIFDPVFLS